MLTSLRLPFEQLMSIMSTDYAAQYRAMVADVETQANTGADEADEVELWMNLQKLIARSTAAQTIRAQEGAQ
jgi:hypothetical protein